MRSRSVAAGTALVILLVGCSQPTYRYVRNTEIRAAFRVPLDWRTYSEDEVLGRSEGVNTDVPDPIQWLVGIDGDPKAAGVPDILDANNLAGDHPEGLALVQELSFVERDAASISYLRNFLFPVDSLIQNASDSRVLVYDDQIQREGFRGVHLVFQFREASLADATSAGASGDTGAGAPTDSSDLQKALLGGEGVAVLTPDFVQVDQTAYLDQATNRIYFIAMLCSASCYARNRADIESAVESWTVLP
jgi:hypothetical protein